MNPNNKLLRIGIPVIATAALLMGLLIGSKLPTRDRVARMSATSLEKFNEVLSVLSANYIDPVDEDSLIEEMIPRMLAELDPHTVYIPAKDLQSVNDDLEGSFSGVGIQYQLMADTITIVEIISGGPAEKVGLMAGDRIVQIDDSVMVYAGLRSDDALKLLRGPKDTSVTVKVKRGGSAEPLTYEITRGDIPVTSIDASYLITPTTGYIKVNKFGRNTFEEFYTSMLLLRAGGAENFILDLRGNGGGYLDVAISMANEFLHAGDRIVETRGRNDIVIESVGADGSGSFKEEPLIVLIDEFSASSSEILAGAIQDNDRGLIIGRRSFGKGLVQTQEELSDGSAMRITTARYYTPSGRCIQKPFKKGDTDAYQLEIYDRYLTGEAFSADSVKLNEDMVYHTASGRKVYGGGGIMPDVFIPADTTNVTGYYTKVINSGLMHKFSFKYADANRSRLDTATSAEELVNLLPSDSTLLNEFVSFAAENGVPTRWYYVNISRPLIVNTLKALIARDVLGSAAFYEIDNTTDNAVNRAISIIESGEASEIRPDNDDD